MFPCIIFVLYCQNKFCTNIFHSPRLFDLEKDISFLSLLKSGKLNVFVLNNCDRALWPCDKLYSGSRTTVLYEGLWSGGPAVTGCHMECGPTFWRLQVEHHKDNLQEITKHETELVKDSVNRMVSQSPCKHSFMQTKCLNKIYEQNQALEN